MWNPPLQPGTERLPSQSTGANSSQQRYLSQHSKGTCQQQHYLLRIVLVDHKRICCALALDEYLFCCHDFGAAISVLETGACKPTNICGSDHASTRPSEDGRLITQRQLYFGVQGLQPESHCTLCVQPRTPSYEAKSNSMLGHLQAFYILLQFGIKGSADSYTLHRFLHAMFQVRHVSD